MLFDNDVVADRKAKARAFTSRLGCEERIEHLFLYFRRHTGSVVANPDLDAITEASGHRCNGRLVSLTADRALAFDGRIKAVGYEIE
jgi:hypothetical protein